MAYTENDSFTTISGVIAFTQHGGYDASSIPTEQQVIDFMAGVAGELQIEMEAAGLSYTVPSGDKPIPSSESALKKAADITNALGAAVLALTAFEVQSSNAYSGKIEFLQGLYEQQMSRFKSLLEKAASRLGGDPSIHTNISGGVQVPTFPPDTSQEITEADRYDTRIRKDNF